MGHLVVLFRKREENTRWPQNGVCDHLVFNAVSFGKSPMPQMSVLPLASVLKSKLSKNPAERDAKL
jgi:hypothetical protein